MEVVPRLGTPTQMLEAQVGLQPLQKRRLVLHSGLPEMNPGNIERPVSACRLNSIRLVTE
jgi:hypothetical protein